MMDGPRTRSVARGGLILLAAALTVSPPVGCRAIERMNRVDMSQRLEHAPPIRLGAVDGRHLIILRAPNPGWSIGIDRAEIARHGQRVFITIRRPDPAYMHQQVIVEKRVLTDVRAEAPITIMARLLGAHESGDDRPYGVLEPVESFQD